jgi:hypothetical protein
MAQIPRTFFALLPVNDEARWVVAQPANKDRWVEASKPAINEPYLAFGPGMPSNSKTAGRLATFGRHKDNDVRLPSFPRPPPPPSSLGHATGTVTVTGAAATLHANDGRSYQNYRNDHCFFFLAASGELILRDLSPCLVHVEVENTTPDEMKLYALHGDPRTGSRQRVIPRTSRTIHITIGTSTRFRLLWQTSLANGGVET